MGDGLKVTKPIVDYGLLTGGNQISATSKESKIPREKTEKIAEDFEALMIFNMLKELNKVSHLTKQEYSEETYMSIVYDKVSRFIAENKGIGIKDLLMRYSSKGGDVKF